MKHLTKVLVLVGAIVGTVGVASAGWAYWSTTGSGTASASVGTLASPGQPSGLPGAGVVSLSWTAATPAPSGGVDGYYVQRNNGGTTSDACGTVSTSPRHLTSSLGCTDTGLTAGTYTYTVTAVFKSWTAASLSSSSIVVLSGAPAKLVFTQQPANSTAGVAFPTQPRVAVLDAGGHTVTSDSSSTVTLILGTNPGGGTLAGTKTVTVSSGVATFSGLSLDKSGSGYTLHATDGTLTAADSSGFNVSPGAVAQLVFTTQPVGGVTEAANFSTSPTVSVEDAFGNVVTSDTGSVTLAVNGYGAGNGGTTQGAITCSNGGFPTISVVAGVATFSNCQITGTAGAGTYTLSATRTGLPQAISSTLTISAGSGTKLAFTSGTGALSNCLQGCTKTGLGNAASGSSKVSVTDSFGNTVSNLGAALTVTVGHSGGTVTPTSLTIPASGSAQSTGSLSWSEGNGNYTDSITLSASGYASVQANLSH